MAKNTAKEAPAQAAPYRVLARKYRPRNFDELIGQEALVRTLKNAIASGRTHHAYMLTGIRGTGKTTTARIIARALNYTGPDGKAGPTAGPTDDCEICRAIAEDRCPDVMEMDAASRTGVDDIREITDGVRYAPVSARYKVYIIDEVHMLSKNAFNALLKTLEEPPPHVIFIFATTEIRKVPVTVISRCQRFDLRRVDAATLAEYYAKICGLEKVKAESEALALVARAADGSVRDGLSLLDQAIALGGDNISARQVRDMLGLADRTQVTALLESALDGDTQAALENMAQMYRAGADPSVVIEDLLETVHLLTRRRAVPNLKDPESEGLAALAQKLSMPTLGRAWQILLKGLGELSYAPSPQSAAEMIVIRLSYAAHLPDPADLLKKLKDGSAVAVSSGARNGGHAPEPAALRSVAGGGATMALSAPSPAPQIQKNVSLASLADIEAALRASEPLLAGEVFHHVHLLKLEPGRLEIRPAPEARRSLANDLGKALERITGARWIVSVASSGGAPTLAQQQREAASALVEQAKAHPVVAEIIRLFPGTEISVKTEG